MRHTLKCANGASSSTISIRSNRPVPYNLQTHLHFNDRVSCSHFELRKRATSEVWLNIRSSATLAVRSRFRNLLSTTKQLQEAHDACSKSSRSRPQVGLESQPTYVYGRDAEKDKADQELWTELLDQKWRLYGAPGVRKVWTELNKSGVGIPVHGSRAKRFWNLLMEVAIPNKTFRERVWKDLQKHLYKNADLRNAVLANFLGPMLVRDPRSSVRWFLRLREVPDISVQLSEILFAAFTSEASLQAFKEIYDLSADRCLYDEILSHLLKRRRFVSALDMHFFLFEHNDYPKDWEVVRQLTQHIQDIGHESLPRFRESLLEAKVNLPTTMKSAIERAKTPKIDLLALTSTVERSKGPLSDHTAARAFATRAFSLNLILTALLTFGLERLGPLAVRELAARCISVEDLAECLERLRTEGVIFDRRAFVKVVTHVAFNRNQLVLDAILENDQHSDVYDDRALQYKLLNQYVVSGDLRQIHRTLMVLTISHEESLRSAWNHVFQACTRAKNWRLVQVITDDMLSQSIPVSKYSIKGSFFNLLRSQKTAGQDISSELFAGSDDLALLTRLWLQIIKRGGAVDPQAWKRILVSYGSAGRFSELESLVVTLAKLYAADSTKIWLPSHDDTPSQNGRSRKMGTYPHAQRAGVQPVAVILEQLFPIGLQRAIVEWGFKLLGQRRVLPDADSDGCLPPPAAFGDDHKRMDNIAHQWERGVNLLRTLEQQGLVVRNDTVRMSCQGRFAILFGSARRVSSRGENRVARNTNPHDRAHMILRVNQIMGRKILSVPAFGSRNATRYRGRAFLSGRRRRDRASRIRPSVTLAAKKSG